MFEKSRRDTFYRSSRKRFLGVYVVLKRSKDSRGRSPEREDYERRGISIIRRDEYPGEMDDNIEEIIPETRPRTQFTSRPSRHKSSKSRYELRYSQVLSSKKASKSINRNPDWDSYNSAHQDARTDDFYQESREVDRFQLREPSVIGLGSKSSFQMTVLTESSLPSLNQEYAHPKGWFAIANGYTNLQARGICKKWFLFQKPWTIRTIVMSHCAELAWLEIRDFPVLDVHGADTVVPGRYAEVIQVSKPSAVNIVQS